MKWNLKVTKVHTGYYSLENDSFIEAEKAARAALAEDIATNNVGSTTIEVRELDAIDVSFVDHKPVVEVEA